MKLPVSAIIVGLNEAHLLKASFPKVAFCDEVIYVDLGSKDNSIEIAEHFGATIIQHEKVVSGEIIAAKFKDHTKHEWVLLVDPDEVLSEELVRDIHNLFQNDILDNTIAAVSAPWIFYFKKHRLIGTNWGGIQQKVLLIQNKRVELRQVVHVGRSILPGFKEYAIPYRGDNFIMHFWMQGYRKLFEKHLRYLKNEGEARYSIGRRTSPGVICLEVYRAFKYSYRDKQGYKDGLLGLFLSLFYTWYETSAQIANYKYQKSTKLE